MFLVILLLIAIGAACIALALTSARSRQWRDAGMVCRERDADRALTLQSYLGEDTLLPGEYTASYAIVDALAPSRTSEGEAILELVDRLTAELEPKMDSRGRV